MNKEKVLEYVENVGQYFIQDRISIEHREEELKELEEVKKWIETNCDDRKLYLEILQKENLRLMGMIEKRLKEEGFHDGGIL